MAKIQAAGATRGAGRDLGLRRRHPGHLAPRADRHLPAPVPGENPFVPGNFVYSPAQSEANQVETADKAHMAATQGGSTPRRRWRRRIHRRRLLRRHDNDKATTAASASSLALSFALLAAPVLAEDEKRHDRPAVGRRRRPDHVRRRGPGRTPDPVQGRSSGSTTGTSARGRTAPTPRPTSASAATGSPSWAPGATRSASTSRASSPSPNLAPVDFSGAGFDTDFQLLDAAVRFSFSDAFKVTVGRFKYNLSRENLEACEDAAHARPLALHPALVRRDA